MDNQELEIRIKEILSTGNFFDMIEKALDFNKEYKTSDFYKKTKMSLNDVIKSGKLWYTFQMEELGSKIQKLIDNLDLENLNSILEQLGSTFAKENEETMNIINSFKDIIK